ncbi:hypothetical protein ASG96_14270 [Terrabacter sp. Soil810]|nr:hypothetical protein ASG96_14270 [Terrabacter sp. Soil810]
MPVTKGFSRNLASRLASGTTTRSVCSSTAAHIESSRAQIEAAKPVVAICCCCVAVMRLIAARGTAQTWAAMSTSAWSSRSGALPRTS